MLHFYAEKPVIEHVYDIFFETIRNHIDAVQRFIVRVGLVCYTG